MFRFRSPGVTLLELLVALLIIAILSSVAISVYTGQVERARYARARDEIRQIEVACHRYEVDTGQFPPSGSFSSRDGCGWLQLALLHSLSGNANRPLDFRWQGPYMDFDANQFGTLTGHEVTYSTNRADIQILDPWHTPYYFVRRADYETFFATELPSSSPFRDAETWYNPSTFQIISFGRDRTSLLPPNRGRASDDVSNFVGSDL